MKKRVIAFLLGFMICFNAVLFSYRRVDAFVDGGLAEGIAVSIIGSIVTSLTYEATNDGLNYISETDANDITQDYIDYSLEAYPENFDEWTEIEKLNAGFSNYDIARFENLKRANEDQDWGFLAFPSPLDLVQDTTRRFFSFLTRDKYGHYDAASNTYNRIVAGTPTGETQTGTYNKDDILAKLAEIYEMHYGSPAPTFGSVYTNDLNNSPYVLIGGDVSDPFLYYATLKNGFDFDPSSNPASCVCVLPGGGIVGAGNCIPIGKIYGMFKYQADAPAGGLSDSKNKNTVVYGPLSDKASKYWTDLESALQDLDQTYGKDVTRHYADGSTSTDKETNVNVPVKISRAVADADGTITYQDLTAEEINELDGTEEDIVFIPLSFSEIADRGIKLDMDTVFEQPAADVVMPDAGTITNTTTGAVSITNTGDIARAIAGTYAGALGDGKIKMDDFEIQRDLTTVFPFCLPFDILRIIKTFVADEAVAPVISFDFSEYYPFNMVPAEYSDNLKFELDMSKFDVLIKIEKFFVIISYIQFLIIKTRGNLIRG